MPFFGMLASSHARWAEKKASPSIVKRLSSSPSANRSSCQTMPKAARSSSPNLASLAKKRASRSAWSICHHTTPSPFLGFRFFHTAAWSSREAEAMVRSSCSFGMSPSADLVENGRVDSREKTELADLADGNGERGGDRLFGPVLGNEAFDGAPQIDTRHRSAHHVFADRPHLVILIGIFDEDVDLFEAEYRSQGGRGGRRRRS